MTTEQIMATMKSFSLKDKTPDKVRDIISTVIDSVIVKQDEIEVIFRLSFEWWRRGESNSCPKPYPLERLRVQPVFGVFPSVTSPPAG